MRGQVLGVDRTSGDGQISGEDGLRYVFTPRDWSDEKGPAVGARVDFTTDGGHALQIFRLPEPDLASPERRPATAAASNDRNKYVAALLAFFFGVLGIHRFYLGRNGSGVLMIVLSITVVGLIVTSIWAIIDMIRYLIMSDAEFAHRYARTYP
jgi:TM2 domain-containing membrane protein YozV